MSKKKVICPQKKNCACNMLLAKLTGVFPSKHYFWSVKEMKKCVSVRLKNYCKYEMHLPLKPMYSKLCNPK